MLSRLNLRLFLPLAALLGSAYIGYYVVGQGRFSEQSLVFLVLGLVLGGLGLYALTVRAEQQLKRLLVCIPLLWLIGIRGVDLGGAMELFVPQVALYALAAILVLRRIVEGRTIRFLHSRVEALFLGIMGVGALSAILNNIRYDIWLQDVLSLGTISAAFFCVYELEVQWADLKSMLSWILGVIILIVFSGLVEMVLGIGGLSALPEQIGFGAITVIRPEETVLFRVAYYFWGGYVASTLILITIPFSIVLTNLAQSNFKKQLLAFSVAVCVIGVIVSGYRGLWVAGLALIAFAFVFLQLMPPFWALMVLVFFTIAAPVSYYARFLSIFTSNTDSSAIDRIERVRFAWEIALRNPVMGAGWGASGWVHNDLMQIAADAGLFAAALFIGGVAWLAFRLLQAPRRWPILHQNLAYASMRWLSMGLGLALVAALLAMVSQTFIVTPIVMAFFALILACAHRAWDLLQQQFDLPTTPTDQPVFVNN